MYASFRESAEFIVRPAIRTAGDVSTDTDYNCPDEDVGCPNTRWVVCALNGAPSTDDKIAFLTCFDGQSLDPVYGSTAKNWTSTCAKESGLDFSTIEACEAGSLGSSLLHEAAAYFEATFPSHAHSGEFLVPHVYIDNVERYPKDGDRSLGHLTKLLCAAGAIAQACSNATVAMI